MEKAKKTQENQTQVEWLSFKTTRKYGYYLYVFSIIGAIFCIGLMTRYLRYIIGAIFEYHNFEIQFLLNFFIPFLGLSFFSYTLWKVKSVLSRSSARSETSESKQTTWMGIIIDRSQAPGLLIITLIPLFYASFMISTKISLIIYYFRSGDILIIIREVLYIALNQSESLIFVGLAIYTLKKMRTFKSADVDESLWFGFELSSGNQFAVFLISLLGVLYTSYFVLVFGILITDPIIYWINHRGRVSSNRFSSIILYFSIITISLIGSIVSFYSLLRVRKISRESAE
jgi:hypothetical protein